MTAITRLIRGPQGPVKEAVPWFAAAAILAAWLAACLSAAASIATIDPARLTDLGLAAIMPLALWLAYGLLSAGFAVSLTGQLAGGMLPQLHLAALAFLLHGIPAIAYGTLRYSWSWKHVGVVDYLLRHGSTGPGEAYLAAYQNWPGLFAVSAAVMRLAGAPLQSLIGAARFFPLAVNLACLLLLPPIFRRFTADRRLVFMACWIFLTGNWVGQDYYSPQAVAFVLYLAVLALCLGPLQLAPPQPDPRHRGLGTLGTRLAGKVVRGVPAAAAARTPGARALAAAAVLVLILAITATHQLTPVAAVTALGTLALARRLSGGYALFAALAMAGWAIYAASPFMAMQLPKMLSELGHTPGSILGRLVDRELVSSGQAIVVAVDRALSLAIALLAAGGFWRRWRRGYREGLAVMLAVAVTPAALGTSYGGEVTFRVYLFALPFLSYLAAAALFPAADAGRGPVSGVLGGALALLLTAGFIIANNGKDRQYWFSQGEVAAAGWLYSTAPPPTLLIEGNRNYPAQFRNYENFTYVPLDGESGATREAIFRDPAGTLYGWLDNDAYEAAYIIITRSQKAYEDDLGLAPRGFLTAIEKGLLASPKFKVVHAAPGALIFGLNRPALP